MKNPQKRFLPSHLKMRPSHRSWSHRYGQDEGKSDTDGTDDLPVTINELSPKESSARYFNIQGKYIYSYMLSQLKCK